MNPIPLSVQVDWSTKPTNSDKRWRAVATFSVIWWWVRSVTPWMSSLRSLSRLIPGTHQLDEALSKESLVPKLNGDWQEVRSKFLYATTKSRAVNSGKE
jgi:hypothetical protein